MDERYRNLAGFRLDVMRDYPATRDLFLEDGQVPDEGHQIRQPALAQLFGMLEQQPVPGDADRVTRVHWLTEMMRRAYRDRAVHMGDPAYKPASAPFRA